MDLEMWQKQLSIVADEKKLLRQKQCVQGFNGTHLCRDNVSKGVNVQSQKQCHHIGVDSVYLQKQMFLQVVNNTRSQKQYYCQ